jgi:hypothetical protein
MENGKKKDLYFQLFIIIGFVCMFEDFIFFQVNGIVGFCGLNLFF